jgi:hypothetical protein
MAFVPENTLEEALLRAINEPKARPEFYRLLFESPLFIIGERGSPAGAASADNDQVMIATVNYQEKPYHPVFSSLSRMQAFVQEEVRYLTVPGHSLFQHTVGANFLLNPGSECGKELRAEEIAGVIQSLQQRPRVLIGQPKEYPTALVEGLKVLFATKPDVIGAYLVQIAFEGQDEAAHPLIGVETTGDWQALAQQMSGVMKEAPGDTVIDMIPIDRANPQGVTQALLQTKPFYARETPNS